MPQISNRNKHSIHQLISNFARQQNFLIKSCILPNHFAMLFDEYLADINNQLIVKIICERVSQLYLFQVKFIWAIELFSYSPLMKAFLLAKQENLFDGELHHLNWQSILENEDPYGTACVLVELKYADLLTEQTLQSLKYYTQPSFLINLLSFFSQIQKLNQENIELIFMHPDPILLNECLKLLIKKFIINMNNGLTIFLKLYHISDLSEFYETLNLMDRCRILNSEYFTMLLNHS